MEDEGASDAIWQVSTDQGWQPWDPRVPFTGQPGEVIGYSLWSHRQPYEARFYEGGVGVQLNVTSGIQRNLRRKDADPDAEAPVAGPVYGARGSTSLVSLRVGQSGPEATSLASLQANQFDPGSDDWRPVEREARQQRSTLVPPLVAPAMESESGKVQDLDLVARVVVRSPPLSEREGTGEAFFCCFSCRPTPRAEIVETVSNAAAPESAVCASGTESTALKAPRSDAPLGGNLF